MTDTKEQELKPCRCGCTRRNYDHYLSEKDSSTLWLARCIGCGTRLKGFKTKAEAIAAWNQYVDPAPAPQWTSEEPTEEGYYWVQFGACGIKVVQVYLDGHRGLRVDHCSIPNHIPVSEFVKRFYVHFWLPIPEPPLPAETEETP